MTDPRDIALPQPTRVGQGTAIEQSRAVAEVYAAVMVARQAPRNVQAAVREMREVCAMPSLAEVAFFEFSRGGGPVHGTTVYLARELGRIWGNLQFGHAELRRDDEHGQSEMLAYAWDVQANSRASLIFIVPHKRDKKGGPVKLVDMRDIYENNSNAGARRLRECINTMLPKWFRDEAETLCRKTLVDGGGKPLAQRVADALSRFADLDVLEADLVRRVGRPTEEWTAATVGDLVTTYQSLKRGEVTREEAFPPAVVSGADIRAGAATVAGHPQVQRAPQDIQDDFEVFHQAGHRAAGAAGERRAFDPECPICSGAEDAELGQGHFYGHTMAFVEGCRWCAQDLQWKRDADGGEVS